MKRFIVIGAILVILVAGMAISSMTKAFADNPGTQGQPSQSCQSVFPSGTFTPNGFNTAGFNHATTVYAQYDVACFQAGQH
jgi:hypothetical protein